MKCGAVSTIFSRLVPHSKLQQAIALRLHPVATERGLVPVLGAYDLRLPADGDVSEVGSPGARGDQGATAALAVEIVTRADDIHWRLSAFADDEVGELVIIDLESRTVDWFALVGDDYEPVDRSRFLDCLPDELVEGIEWPKPAGP